MKFKRLRKLFKKRYPYAPIAYLGRKTVEETLGANIAKLKKVEKAQIKQRARDKDKN